MSRTRTGSTAVVTGAGSGIGQALALRLAASGSNVVCADINLETAEATAAQLRRQGASAIAVACDVTQLAQVEALADAAVAAFGTVDLVINNAGIGAGGRSIGEEPIATWRRTIDINLWGVIHGCHVFTPLLRAQGSGGIINLASAAGFAAAPGMGPYNASKAAVMSVSETLAAELAGSGVTVTVVCPTFVKTNIVADGDIEADSKQLASRLMAVSGRSPDSIASAILRGHAAGRSYVVPQLEARAVWAAKRHAPRAYLAGSRLLGRAMKIGRQTAVPASDAATIRMNQEIS
jgi:NAD(P)-dependent dehydrogenase (short-subunit alcohol dehydrogenase family)